METSEKGTSPESFDESLAIIAEKVKTEKEHSKEEERADAERMKQLEMEQISKKVHEVCAAGGCALERVPPPVVEKVGKDAHLTAIDEVYRDDISVLLQSAVSDGIWSAVRSAKKRDDPYFIDAFHDALVYFLHEKMRDQNLL